MKQETTKTLRVGCILLVIFFLFCALALLPQPVRATNTVVATITVGSEPVRVAVTPDGAYAYVTNFGSGSVSVISTATNTVTATVTVGNSPYGVAVTPNGAYAYVTNFGSSSVSVISTATNTVTANVTDLSGPAGVAVTPNGEYAYVTNGVSGSGSVSVISTRASGQAVGVKVGDWVKYDAKGTLRDLAGIDWAKVEITNVVGINVTARMTQHMLNGTESTPQETVLTIGSSQGGPAGGFIIPANSKVGDTVSFNGNSFPISQETTRTYGGVSRTVVSGNFSAGTVPSVVFWDKPSGFLLEESMSSQGQSLSIVASAFSISGANAGGGGELLGLDWWIWVIIIAVVAVVMVGLAFMLLRRKHPATTVPPVPETPPPP